MTSTEVDAPEPGRRVVLVPTPPGLWLTLLGGGCAVLAPVLGFLVGGMLGVGETTDTVDPLFLALFVGIVIGGIGLLVALVGIARLWKHFHAQDLAGP